MDLGRSGFVTLPWPDREKGPYMAQVRLGEVAGRYEVVEVAFGSATDNRAITTKVLQRARLADLAAETAAIMDRGGAWRSFDPGVPFNWDAMDRVWQGLREEAVAPERAAAERARRLISNATSARRHYLMGHLEYVAAVYSEAYRRRKPTTQAVAEALGVSGAAAAKQVWRARQKGLLPETIPGKAAGPSRRKRSRPV